jgi:heat shock protein HspQ
VVRHEIFATLGVAHHVDPLNPTTPDSERQVIGEIHRPRSAFRIATLFDRAMEEIEGQVNPSPIPKSLVSVRIHMR